MLKCLTSVLLYFIIVSLDYSEQLCESDEDCKTTDKKICANTKTTKNKTGETKEKSSKKKQKGTFANTLICQLNKGKKLC